MPTNLRKFFKGLGKLLGKSGQRRRPPAFSRWILVPVLKAERAGSQYRTGTADSTTVVRQTDRVRSSWYGTTLKTVCENALF